MLALILSSAPHALATGTILAAGAGAIWLLPWRDAEVQVTREALSALAEVARRGAARPLRVRVSAPAGAPSLPGAAVAR